MGEASPGATDCMVTVDEALARRATALLVAIGDGDEPSIHEYYQQLFPFLGDVALRRGRLMAEDAAQQLGFGDGRTIVVSEADRESVAYDAAKLALWRAAAAADRFDPQRGDGVRWALGSLGTAYLDTARDATRARRRYSEVVADLDELERSTAWLESPEHQVEARAGLEWALGTLTVEERAVIIARLHYGASYTEIAHDVLGDPSATKRVDRLLQSARTKLERAHASWVEDP